MKPPVSEDARQQVITLRRRHSLKEVAERFRARPDLLPNTLSDCLHEMAYWPKLHWLRNAVGGCGCGDGPVEARARETFAFQRLAQIRPRSKAEAIAVFRYLAENDGMDRTETESILLNLIG